MDNPKSTTPTTNQPPADDPSQTAAQQGAQDTTDWKAEARKWEARAKANSDAADRLKKLEDEQKTEVQRQADALAAAQAAEKALQAKIAVFEAAARLGVPAELLAGPQDDDLDAYAEKLSKWKAEHVPTSTDTTGDGKANTGGSPAPSLGRTPAGTGVLSIDEQIAAAEKAGNETLVKTLKVLKLGK
ncbi:hypothetical protein [Actinobaculum sp. 352]|uniref:hypothetical protein n=1 Tax=Actinobaculum sp. 352 TaxID=2490946 RepID=UPI000F7EC542|nr:hypothetical protein [Actinobaculum sp. 352]RTE47737.1 hypothetical protein EKN07_12170 [Actinobaculum sp. 352]